MDNYTDDCGVFDNFYVNYLELIEEKCISCFSKYHPEENLENVFSKVLIQEKSNLIELCSRTLIQEFKEYKETMKVEGDAYNSFNIGFTEKQNIEKILKKYPVLDQLINQEIGNVNKNIDQIFERLYNDKNEIEKTFDIKLNELASIDIGTGDTHNGGLSVAILHFASGTIVYKPHDLYTDLAYAKICEYLKSRNNTIDLRYAKSLSKEEYGWQQWVEYKECESMYMVKKYCNRLGIMLAIFRALRTTDVHMENIIPCGEYPVIIDLETLCSNGIIDLSEDSIASNFNEEYFNSVLASCLLPNRSINTMLDIDITGLGAGEKQKSKKFKMECIVAKGTEDIDIREEMVESFYHKVLRCNNKKVDYTLYIEDIIEGFQKTYFLIMEHKRNMFEAVQNSFSRAKFRQVLRGTFIYDKFLKASYGPNYLISLEERRRVLSIINTQDTKKEREEYKQLLNSDIPYFFSRFEDCHLYSYGGIVEADYFRKSIKDEVLDNLMVKMNEDDCMKQINLIQNAFKFNYTEKIKNMYTDELNPLDENNQEKNIRKIFEHIKKLAIWNKERTRCTFYDVGISPTGDYKIDILGNGLYNGVGLVLFLYTYALKTGKTKDMEFAGGVLAGFEEQYNSNELVMNTSIFSGVASHLYMYYILQKRIHNSNFMENYETIIKKVEDYQGYDKEDIMDIIGGSSGLLIVLANIFIESHEIRIRRLIEKFSKKLYEYIQCKGVELNGFAHGRAGMATALVVAGTLLEEKRYCDRGIELFKEEDKFYIECDENWKDLRGEGNDSWMWCHGAPGCLLARTLSVKFNPELKHVLINSLFKRAHQKLITEFMVVSEGDSICHGSFGNLEILDYITQSGILETTMDNKKSYDYLKKIISRINKKGLILGIAGSRGIVSFMLGISGIGYTLMRQLDKTLPSLLALEV